jgi:Chaperone of endosialidase
MFKPIHHKTATLPNSISCSLLRHGFLLIALALALTWLALSPRAQAVSPAPDGGYPNNNTAEGTGALFSLTSGTYNTANGAMALHSLTSGNYNTAIGAGALYSNTTGTSNTANGAAALASNTTGGGNTATGGGALAHNTTGNGDTANGTGALGFNTIGSQNTANGDGALYKNTSGGFNTANGDAALYNNTIGVRNTANGDSALEGNTTGGDNTAEGFQALIHNTTGLSNIAVGSTAGANLTTGSNNIDIGNQGVAAEANTIRIGTVGTQTKTFIAGIHGATASGGAAVFVNSSGELGTLTSSARFKEAIKPMDKASEAILALKPVTFHYKKELDPDGIPQFGLVAEQVEKVNPDLVARDTDGKVYTVRYEAVNAMLLNEFLKEHRKVEELKSTVAKQEATAAQQQKEIKALTASLKEQASQIQKVSDNLEVSRCAPQLVVDD